MAVAIRDKTTATQLMAVNSDGSINPPALTKGTQGAIGLSVQNLLDAGRNVICWTVDRTAAASASEGMVTVTASVNGAATTTYSSYTITSGKYLYIPNVNWSVYNSTGSVIQQNFLRIRVNTAGAAVVASPLQFTNALITLAAASSLVWANVDIPNGLIFLGNGTTSIGVSWLSPQYSAGTVVSTLSLTMNMFEY